MFWCLVFEVTDLSVSGQAKLREAKDQLMQRRHQPVPDQGRWLRSVVQGHFAYYAVLGNTDAVAAFRTQVGRHWFKALRRRSRTLGSVRGPLARAVPTAIVRASWRS